MIKSSSCPCRKLAGLTGREADQWSPFPQVFCRKDMHFNSFSGQSVGWPITVETNCCQAEALFTWSSAAISRRSRKKDKLTLKMAVSPSSLLHSTSSLSGAGLISSPSSAALRLFD